MRALVPFVLLVGLVACTTDPDDPIATGGSGAFFTRTGGNFDRLSITATDGAATLEAGHFHGVIMNADNVCGSGAKRQNRTILTIDVQSTTAQLTPGTYTQTEGVSPAPFGISVVKVDATCNAENGQSFASKLGSTSITTVSATYVEGTFGATLADGTTLTGSFNVPICPSLKLDACAP